MSLADRVLGAIARITSRFKVWHRWPFLLAVSIVVGHRVNLRHNNLTDTETAPLDVPPLPPDFDHLEARTPNGSYNDLGVPWMGMAGTRFGRNVPLAECYGETAPRLFDPSPRLISNKLLARGDFVPVPHLNLLAAAWIQFMVHDWLSHGPSDKTRMHQVPLPPGDDWDGGSMQVPITRADTGPDAGSGRPVAFRNTETSWWDASQIYGSSLERQMLVRTEPGAGTPRADGKLALTADRLLPADSKSSLEGLELAGVNGNWWIGLSLLHTLFALEHNAIVDRLRIDHPDRSGEWLFQKARLVNAALLAKIHTVEWTPALMDSPEGRMIMRGNFWGAVGEKYIRAFGRVGDSEVLSGIPGSPQDHHGVPYAMTDEFAAAYRLHSLMPDTFEFRSHKTDAKLLDARLDEVAGGKVPGIYKQVSYTDALYSFGTSHPGALVLHNFPNSLRNLNKKAEENVFVDLAAVDILRDRERGVPRYCAFRRLIGAYAPKTFAEMTDDEVWQTELAAVYRDVEDVDLLVGTLAESKCRNGTPPRFGFSDTAFRIFILMASRRLKSDRFFTDDFRPEIYTRAGFAWVQENSLRTVLQRHCPALQGAFADARNVFFPWARSV